MNLQMLRDVFKELDADGNGVLDKEEFSKFGEICGSEISPENLAKLFAGIDDASGETDGVLNFREFCLLIEQLFEDDEWVIDLYK